jgi:hypothetical protein
MLVIITRSGCIYQKVDTLCQMLLLSRKVSENVSCFCTGQSLLIGFASLSKNTGKRSFQEPQTLVFLSSFRRLFACPVLEVGPGAGLAGEIRRDPTFLFHCAIDLKYVIVKVRLLLFCEVEQGTTETSLMEEPGCAL